MTADYPTYGNSTTLQSEVWTTIHYSATVLTCPNLTTSYMHCLRWSGVKTTIDGDFYTVYNGFAMQTRNFYKTTLVNF